MSMRVSATGVTVRGTNTGRGRGRTAAREAGGGDAMVANIESGAEGSAHCREVAGRRMRGYAYSRVDRGEERRREVGRRVGEVGGGGSEVGNGQRRGRGRVACDQRREVDAYRSGIRIRSARARG
jgi:hypothetical protein